MGERDGERQWETRQVRAYNLKPGDVMSFLNMKRRAEERRTVASVVESETWPGDVEIRFRRWRWGLHLKRTMLVRVRRLGRGA